MNITCVTNMRSFTVDLPAMPSEGGIIFNGDARYEVLRVITGSQTVLKVKPLPRLEDL